MAEAATIRRAAVANLEQSEGWDFDSFLWAGALSRGFLKAAGTSAEEKQGLAGFTEVRVPAAPCPPAGILPGGAARRRRASWLCRVLGHSLRSGS